MKYLTDEQYLKCLRRIAWNLADPNFKMEGEDSTCIRDKYTKTNFGMCNDEGLCDAENAMWPDQYPERKSLAHQEEWQLCPCDSRVFTFYSLSDLDKWRGCFYSCYYFTHRIQDQTIIKDLMLLSVKHITNEYLAYKKYSQEQAKRRERARVLALEEERQVQKKEGLWKRIKVVFKLFEPSPL